MNPSERESSYNDDSSTILLLQDENPPEEVDAPERSMNRKQFSFYISQFTATLIELNISYIFRAMAKTIALLSIRASAGLPLRSLNLAFNNFSTKSDIEIEKFNTIQLPKSLRTLIFSGNINRACNAHTKNPIPAALPLCTQLSIRAMWLKKII